MLRDSEPEVQENSGPRGSRDAFCGVSVGDRGVPTLPPSDTRLNNGH